MRARRALTFALLSVLMLAVGCGESEVELDAAAAEDLHERIEAAQEGVTSSRTEVYMSVRLEPPGGGELELPEALVATVTVAGDRSYTRFDALAWLIESGLPAENIDAEERKLAIFEWTTEGGRLVEPLALEGGERVYVRLAPLLIGMPDQPQWVLDLADEHGGNVTELWGLVDLRTASPASIEVLSALAPMLVVLDEVPEPEELPTLDPEVTGGELHSLGRAEVGGVDVERYRVDPDAGEIAGLAAIMGDFVEIDDTVDLRYIDAIEGEIFVDEHGYIRRRTSDVDIGMWAELMRESGDFADEEIPDVSGHFLARLDTMLINNRALSVELPHPSLVVELP